MQLEQNSDMSPIMVKQITRERVLIESKSRKRSQENDDIFTCNDEGSPADALNLP
jgi:hypothetical protein